MIPFFKNSLSDKWKPVNFTGDKLSIEDEYIIATDPLRARIWRKDKLLFDYISPDRVHCYPVMVKRLIYWGDGYINIYLKKFFRFQEINKMLSNSAENDETIIPGQYAWSPTADLLAISAGYSSERKIMSKVILFHPVNKSFHILWKTNANIPKAITVSRSYIMLAADHVFVYSKNNCLVNVIQTATPAFRLAIDNINKHFLICEHQRIALYNLEKFSLIKEWKGNWIDASLAPDGSMLALVNFEGEIYITNNNNFQLMQLEAPGHAFNISLSNNQIICSFINNQNIHFTKIK